MTGVQIQVGVDQAIELRMDKQESVLARAVQHLDGVLAITIIVSDMGTATIGAARDILVLHAKKSMLGALTFFL